MRLVQILVWTLTSALQIRYYARKETLLTQAAEVAAKAFGTGQMATPGAIRTITGKEVSTRISVSQPTRAYIVVLLRSSLCNPVVFNQQLYRIKQFKQ